MPQAPVAAQAGHRKLRQLARSRARTAAAESSDPGRSNGHQTIPGTWEPRGAGGANVRLSAGDDPAAPSVRTESLAERPRQPGAVGTRPCRVERPAEAGSGAA